MWSYRSRSTSTISFSNQIMIMSSMLHSISPKHFFSFDKDSKNQIQEILFLTDFSVFLFFILKINLLNLFMHPKHLFIQIIFNYNSNKNVNWSFDFLLNQMQEEEDLRFCDHKMQLKREKNFTAFSRGFDIFCISFRRFNSFS